MGKQNFVNAPNDTVVVIGKVLKYDKDTFIIMPQEVALGKINNDTKDFLCMDNQRIFPELKEIIRDAETAVDKLYYFVPNNLDVLIDRFHIDANMEGAQNAAMVMFMKNIREHIVEARVAGEDIDIRFIEKEKLSKMPDKPNLNAVSKPTIILPGEEIVLPDAEEIITPSEYVNPLGVKIDLEYFIKYMKERVMNNEEEIEDICTTISYNLTASNPYDVENILSIGPTGSGKTETVRVIKEWAKPYKIPVAIFDSTALSSAGYKGKDVDDYLKSIYLDSGKNPALYERAIFALDELDKLKASELEMKEAAQDSLLKVVEGNVFDVEIDKFGSTVQMDTTGMTVYGLGAFSSLFEKKSKDAHPLGFSPALTKEEIEKLRYEVTTEDLVKYGFKSEFIPRFPNLFIYQELDKDGLRKVLTQSKRSVLLRTVKRFLEQFNTEVEYDESFIEAFIEKTLENKSGGRSLNKISAKTFKKAQAEIMKADFKDNGKRKVLKITGDTVSNPRKFTLE